jgi:hypothetical protein
MGVFAPGFGKGVWEPKDGAQGSIGSARIDSQRIKSVMKDENVGLYKKERLRVQVII